MVQEPSAGDDVTAFTLDELPLGAALRSVTAVPADVTGRRALRVQLTEAIAVNGVPDVDYVDMPTFAVIPGDFENGTIEVEILARLTSAAPDYARGFAGIAYRIAEGCEAFESVYLRPLNGRKTNPPAPRDTRAVQYFAYPDWKYERLRGEYPDGRYEAGADIGPNEWTSLRIDVDGADLDVSVNGVPVLGGVEAKARPRKGAVGLWVDIGTEAYFSNLVITRR